LSAGGAVYAKGPGGTGGGQGYGHMSGQGAGSQNAKSMEGAKRGQQRADQGSKKQEKPMEQERQRVQDGSGAQHENRTMTQEQIMTSATQFIKLDAIADAVAAS
jgi:hypothetical protein